MELEGGYLTKYLHEFAVNQISNKYKNLGYETIVEKEIGKYKADLFVKKGKERIYFEIKAGELSTKQKHDIIRIKQNIKREDPNADFRIVTINPPKKIRIEIEDIEGIIYKCLINELPSEVDSLSTHSRILEVSDTELYEVRIAPDNIFLKGIFMLEVGLQFGSDSDVKNDFGAEMKESFPADFEIEANGNLEVTSFKTKVDTSSWSE